MKFLLSVSLSALILFANIALAQSPSFQTFINPVIPGDHPDPTLTKIGNYFYTSGSSFNPTPKIYRSTNLVNWEVISQPVPPDWATYGNNPGGGAWGGHLVLYNDKYWHFFGRGGGRMYFVTADDPAGPWSQPTAMDVPPGLGGNLGVDNSIFIDEDSGRWFLLTKAGHSNNHLVELGNNGQPNGTVLNLSWLNPESEGRPYGWAEGPVMWKHGEYYYYSFAEHLVGEQYVMRSRTLTEDKEAWTVRPGNMFWGSRASFDRPNHISPAVTLDDGTSWAIGHSYHTGNWKTQGRQGLLHQVVYNNDDWPLIQFPTNFEEVAPNLPSGGIPWMVPKSDMFDSQELHPEWSHLGYTPRYSFSLTSRPGWLYLDPHITRNTVIKNDGEHNYSLITRVDFEPDMPNQEAGLWIFNGPESHFVKVFSSVNSNEEPILVFSYEQTRYEVPNTVGTDVWLKLVRDDHIMRGFYSADGHEWTQIGQQINASSLGIEHTQFNDFTGNQQGPYVIGQYAYFNLYIYRDAYTDIIAKNAANRNGVIKSASFLGNITNDNWALYAGVEFGSLAPGSKYQKKPEQISISASSQTNGGIVEVWLDSIDTGRKIAEVIIENTGFWSNYQNFNAPILSEVSGRHDVYLRFKGNPGETLMRLDRFKFLTEPYDVSISPDPEQPVRFNLAQNYPNPFNPVTSIPYQLPQASYVRLEVFDALGRSVAVLVNEWSEAGQYNIQFDAGNLASGIYVYRLQAGDFTQTRKLTLMK